MLHDKMTREELLTLALFDNDGIDDTDAYKLVTDTTASSVKTLTTAPLPFNSLKVGIEAVQDLHGYDKPWAGGANVNKFPNALSGTQTKTGITVVSDKGTYTISGTAEANTSITFDLVDDFTFPISVAQGGEGVIYLGNDFVSAVSQLGVYFYYNNTMVGYFTFTDYNRVSNSYSNSLGGQTINKVNFYIPNGASISGKCRLMCVNNSSTTETFSPYSNICPITGWDAVNLNISDADTSNPTTYTENLATTNYGGYWDVTKGVLPNDEKLVDFSTAAIIKNDISNPNDYLYYIPNLPVDTGKPIMCSHAPFLNNPPIGNVLGTAVSGRGSIYINLTSNVMAENTVAYFQQYCINNNVQIKYGTTTPTTTSTTPRFIKANDGTTNLWADSGKIEKVGYFKEFNA